MDLNTLTNNPTLNTNITVLNVLTWLVFGLIVGILANLIDPGKAKGGVLGAIILGIVGSIVGGLLGNMLFGTEITGFNLTSLILAVAGALLILTLYRMLFRSSSGKFMTKPTRLE